ncbi:MAG TPA: acetone carboxylase subunit gamma [Dehalococcoidia bacterium]|nr:acetone carboxylase subunit gamma [Dehalococcoidia bacterium]
MPEISYPKEVIRDLIEGKLPWNQLKSIISGYKDNDRFDKYVAVLQEKVPWQERILLPLTDELYIVQKGKERIVKCSCGYEFGDYRENWKLKALIHVRDTEAELDEIYPYPSKPEPGYCEMREHYCPGCGIQLEVDTVPFGYPAVFDFLPDLDTFYRDWLRRPLDTKLEFTDLSYELTRRWSAEGRESIKKTDTKARRRKKV